MPVFDKDLHRVLRHYFESDILIGMNFIQKMSCEFEDEWGRMDQLTGMPPEHALLVLFELQDSITSLCVNFTKFYKRATEEILKNKISEKEEMMIEKIEKIANERVSSFSKKIKEIDLAINDEFLRGIKDGLADEF